MSLQHAAQPRSSSNGLGRRRVEREIGVREDNNIHIGKPISSNSNRDHVNSHDSSNQTASRDRLIFISTCLIGHSVEVHVKNGSTLYGIFHAINAEKDFGIVLKMARVKDGSFKGHTITSDINNKPQTIIVPGKELLQVIAKDVALTGKELPNESVHKKRQDLMTDSAISLSHRAEERELEPWAPDDDDPECPELDDIFDGTWNRSWDQFETNATLFGVKSTFNEELYTTKLERGPQMIELEREAIRIAREIEEEDTDDLHLAEERGSNLHENFEYDEESRFSAVQRVADDFTRDSNITFDKNDDDTFGSSFDTKEATLLNGISGKRSIDTNQASLSYVQMDAKSSHSAAVETQIPCSVNEEPKVTPERGKNQFVTCNGANDMVDEHAKPEVFQKYQSLNIGDPNTSNTIKESLSLGSKQSTSHVEETRKISAGSHTEDSVKTSTVTVPVGSHQHFASSTSTSPNSKGDDKKTVSASPGLSPSSSLGSLSSEKSTLNPYAKEFKLNPHAKVFKPSSSLRPHTPVPETSVYYTTNYVPGLSMGVGITPSFSPQQPVYNPQNMNIQPPQAYIPNSAHLYGQPMMLAPPRPYVLMPTYPPEMQYRGREF